MEELYSEGDVVTIRVTLKPEAVPSVFNPPSMELEAGSFTLENNVGDTLNFIWPEVDSQPSRFEKTLGTLTQRFVGMLKGSADGVLDINVAAAALNISKRRIYDIIHVLEGISLTRKKSKNIVEWLGGPPNVSDELNALVKEESRLDFLIKCCTRQIQQMYENLQNQSLCFLTYEDIQMIPIFKEQTVFVIKAPPETKLEVPHPAESFQIHINSTQGPVEVFLCSDEGVNVSKRKTATTVDDGDYSYVPLPCLATDAPFSEDDANHNTRNNTISEPLSEPTQHISQVTITPSTDDPTSAQPPSEDHPHCATLTSSMKGSLNEEQSHLNPPPDEPMTDDVALSEYDQLLSDVHMADAS